MPLLTTSYHTASARSGHSIKQIFLAHAVRLYEQEPGEAGGFPILGLTVERWGRWPVAGLPSLTQPSFLTRIGISALLRPAGQL